VVQFDSAQAKIDEHIRRKLEAWERNYLLIEFVQSAVRTQKDLAWMNLESLCSGAFMPNVSPRDGNQKIRART
jgi:hypothetical protein